MHLFHWQHNDLFKTEDNCLFTIKTILVRFSSEQALKYKPTSSPLNILIQIAEAADGQIALKSAERALPADLEQKCEYMS